MILDDLKGLLTEMERPQFRLHQVPASISTIRQNQLKTTLRSIHHTIKIHTARPSGAISLLGLLKNHIAPRIQTRTLRTTVYQTRTLQMIEARIPILQTSEAQIRTVTIPTTEHP